MPESAAQAQGTAVQVDGSRAGEKTSGGDALLDACCCRSHCRLLRRRTSAGVRHDSRAGKRDV